MRKPSITMSAVMLINVVSAVCAAYGLYAALTANPTLLKLLAAATAQLPDYTFNGVLIVGSAILGILIQWLLVGAWMRVFGSSPGDGVSYLPSALATSLTSGLMSAASLSFAVSAGPLTDKLRDATVAPYVAEFKATSEAVTAMSDRADGLARTAARLNTREAEVGGTCQGARKIVGEGPMARLRARHADTAASVAETALTLADDLATLAVDIAAAPPEKVAQIHRSALARLRTNEVVEMRRALSRMRSDLADGFVDPDTGKIYSCPTPGFLSEVKALDKDLATALSLEATPPEARSAQPSDSFTALFTGVWNWLSGRSGGPDPIGLWALGVAAGVELLQISLLFNRARVLRLTGLENCPFSGFWDEHRQLTGTQRQEHRRLLQKLDAQTLRVDGRPYFVAAAPRDADDRLVIAFFGLNEPSAEHREVPLRKLMPLWVAPRSAQFGDAQSFDLFTLPRKVAAWKRTATRDAGIASDGQVDA